MQLLAAFGRLPAT